MLCSFKATIPKIPLKAKKKKKKKKKKKQKQKLQKLENALESGKQLPQDHKKQIDVFEKTKNISGNKDSDLLNFRFFSDSPVFPVTLDYHTKGRAIQLSIS